MAVPPTLVMSVNVLFVVGAVSVPGLWSLVEYLFQAALVGFLAIGAFALRLYGRYPVRMITTVTYDFIASVSLSRSWFQPLPSRRSRSASALRAP
jgi:hypothetical protein